MATLKHGFVAVFLAAAVACAPAGCATMVVERPTRETFTTYMQDGDQVEIALKSGERRKFTITKMGDDALWGDAAGIRYADMASVWVLGRKAPEPEEWGTTHEGRKLSKMAMVAGAVCVVVLAPAAALWGLCGLAGASRHW